MPIRSKAQLAFLFIHHPALARRWIKEYGIPKKLPYHTKRKGHTKKY